MMLLACWLHTNVLVAVGKRKARTDLDELVDEIAGQAQNVSGALRRRGGRSPACRVLPHELYFQPVGSVFLFELQCHGGLVEVGPVRCPRGQLVRRLPRAVAQGEDVQPAALGDDAERHVFEDVAIAFVLAVVRFDTAPLGEVEQREDLVPRNAGVEVPKADQRVQQVAVRSSGWSPLTSLTRFLVAWNALETFSRKSSVENSNSL
jgi:hypothetical protein